MSNLKELVKRTGDTLINNTIYDLLKLVCTILFVGTAGSFAMYITHNWIYFVLVALISSIIAIVGLKLFTEYNNRKHKFIFKSIKSLLFYENDRFIVIDIYTVKAQKKEQDSIYDSHNWLSDEKMNIECLTAGVSLKVTSEEKGIMQYRIHFNRELKKGEEVSYVTRFEGTDLEKQFPRYFERALLCPVNSIKIEAVIDDAQKFERLVYNAGYDYNNEKRKKTFDKIKGYHEWTISNPKLGEKYRLSW